ncbi:hypothetical protein F0L68_18305 [Solihabitans fulvus]|uniref:Uncharacterized protein n=2 Tax=Solihabitans fulvus TaxID=1892852 RepID=A0A5B2XEK9_9PSEU|nr:hypothetical protein F0L68_18305 [Solihabitans fulvus]
MVRGKDQILATLDKNGRLGGLPFMPEMLAFAGQEMRVFKRADKTCDTIEQTGTRRRLEKTVHLVGARCDGSAHGGCQAGCLLFFREEWLAKEDGTPLAEVAEVDSPPTEADLDIDTQQDPGADGEPRYRCQTTELLNFTSGGLSPYDWSQYVTDVRTGNERLGTVLRGLLILFFNIVQRRTRRLPFWLRIHDGDEYPFLRGTGPSKAPEPLNLQPGELVEIKSKAEILPTLKPNNTNRGMVFDAEMLPYCGKQARVQRRLDRIIDEPTGRMITLRDCLILEDVYCRALYHRFCPRSIYPYWREAWLRRVDQP